MKTQEQIVDVSGTVAIGMVKPGIRVQMWCTEEPAAVAPFGERGDMASMFGSGIRGGMIVLG